MILKTSYCMSYPGLKLLGQNRLCNIDDFSFDYGLGLFAGLLPERFVFDSRLTTYENLNRLNQKGILFITLKRQGSKTKNHS